MKTLSSRDPQGGLGIVSLLLIAIIVALAALMGMKVFPTAMEYIAIKRAVDKAVLAGGGPEQIKAAFDRSAAVEDITSIAGKDLVISQEGGKSAISFAYEKRIPLFGPAILLLDYKGNVRR